MNDDLPEVARATLALIAAYRTATKRLVHADRPLRVKCLGLLDLAEAGRAERDPTVRAWIAETLWREAEQLLTGRPASLAGDGYERATRKLRADGYLACPTCRSSLPDEATFDRWRLLRTQGVADA